MRFSKALLISITGIGFAGAAQAELRICNETASVQSISIGYNSADGWTSEGWWNIQPGECSTPVGDALDQSYYYLRAEVDAGPFEGSYAFCTSPEAYTIVGDSDCEARGYDQENFIELFTDGATSFTHTLTQEAMDLAQGTSSGGGADDGGSEFGLEFCNQTEFTQAVSIGYEGADGWTSEGWWNVEPNACSKPIGDALQKRYYYYRAEIQAGDFNGGGYSFCTSSEAYTIVGDTDCEDRGYVTEDFAEIDTGTEAKGFSVLLTAETGGIAPSGGGDGAAAGTSDTASADGLQFCNETSMTQSVSVGYEGAEGWTSEGWWNVEPGACSTPLSGPLEKQYYYYRAEVEAGPFEGEGYTFCTSSEAYTIVGDTDCEARGHVTEDFREVNVGAGNTSHVVTLTSATGGTLPEGGGDSTATNGAASGTDDITTTDAGLEVCNETEFTQSLSFGYNGAEGWTSEGWWNAEPGACVTPALDGVRHDYVYYRAEVDGGDFEGESYFFCTSSEAYTIVGDTDCEARGHDREDFREVALTGEGMFTLTLAPGDGGVAPAGGGDTGGDTGGSVEIGSGVTIGGDVTIDGNATTGTDDTANLGGDSGGDTGSDTGLGATDGGDTVDSAAAGDDGFPFEMDGMGLNPRAGSSRLR